MRENKLISGAYWQEELKQKGINKWGIKQKLCVPTKQKKNKLNIIYK